MSLFNSYDRTTQLGESNFPYDSGSGVVTPAVQKANLRKNIFGNTTGAIGYSVGDGGAVTQLTSRTTGVTLNKPVGAITLFAAAPAVGTYTSFVVTDSAVGANDVVAVSVGSANAANSYIALVTNVSAGTFTVAVSTVVGTTSDSPVLNYAVIKGAAS